MDRNLVKNLRLRIREFEDRKISGSALCREIHLVAHEVDAPDEASLRLSLVTCGLRISAVVEQGDSVQSKVLEVVDSLESELCDWGY